MGAERQLCVTGRGRSPWEKCAERVGVPRRRPTGNTRPVPRPEESNAVRGWARDARPSQDVPGERTASCERYRLPSHHDLGPLSWGARGGWAAVVGGSLGATAVVCPQGPGAGQATFTCTDTGDGAVESPGCPGTVRTGPCRWGGEGLGCGER